MSGSTKRAKGSDPDGTITFPPEWKLGKDWMAGFPQILLSPSDDADDHRGIFAAGGVLTDGTNLIGLCWPGGQRLLRVSPDTDWALEERFDGDAPENVQRIWRLLIKVQVGATAAAEAEWGGRP